MGKPPQPWWKALDIGADTERRVADRAAETPDDLAGLARGAPDAFKSALGDAALADLKRALRAYLASIRGETIRNQAGYESLLKIIEELTGDRAPKKRSPAPQLPMGARLDPPPPRPHE